MLGLYGFVGLRHSEPRVCVFPYELPIGNWVIEQLRRIDPPIDEHIVPDIPIAGIAPENRVFAYHLLLRSVWFMLSRDEPLCRETMPYLMAFSVLAKVRFGYVECAKSGDGVTIRVSILHYTDIEQARAFFETAPTPTIH